jgi:catechol 2,3-dioxygenase-like lactoylglutathione lyase family enzyme
MPTKGTQIFDHIGLSVADLARSKAFYLKSLAPLDIAVVLEIPASVTGDFDAVGFGREGKPSFWLANDGATAPRLHVAFTADSRSGVDAFYRAAISAGGADNGVPGLRPHYHSNYYGAFVLDPDGHNIEAVCHRPE